MTSKWILCVVVTAVGLVGGHLMYGESKSDTTDPKPAFREHQAKIVVLCCMDDRFRELVDKVMKKEFSGRPYFLLSGKGASKKIVDPISRSTMLEDIATAVGLGATDLVIIHHDDCAAYAHKSRKFQCQQMDIAAGVIHARFPTLKVHTRFAGFEKVETITP